jgi:hypothetical protein
MGDSVAGDLSSGAPPLRALRAPEATRSRAGWGGARVRPFALQWTQDKTPAKMTSGGGARAAQPKLDGR